MLTDLYLMKFFISLNNVSSIRIVERKRAMLKKIHLILGIFFMLISICGSAFAAGQGMHVLLAERWMEAQDWHYISNQKQAFIVGTLFPDIRYLGVLKREETHEQNLTRQDICEQKEKPFEAGRKLHVWVDELREKFAEEWKIYEKLPNSVYTHRATFLKLLEDEIIWNNLNIVPIIEALDNIEPEEEKFKVEVNVLKQWHSLLSRYIQIPPAQTLSNLSRADKGFFNIPKEEVALWSKLIPELKEDKEICRYVGELLTYLNEKFISEKAASEFH